MSIEQKLSSSRANSYSSLPPIISFEQNIIHLFKQEDSFYQYRLILQKDPSFTLTDQLEFPEILCTTHLPKPLKEYESTFLTPKDPLFKPLQTLLKKLQAHPPLREESEQVRQNLTQLYQTFINQVCQSSKKERIQLLKGKVRLYGIVEGCFLLENKQAQEITSCDKYDQVVKTNPYGASAVKKIKDVYFKRALFNFLSPGMEYAVEGKCNKISRQLF